MAAERRAFFRTPEDLRVHRQQLYRRAAGVFQRRGYRGAGLKELAAACGLSIPALYRYFPSKRDFALYPLAAINRPTDACFAHASDDPYTQVRLWLDHAAWERPDFVLALRLGAELEKGGGLSDEHMQTFGYHIGLMAQLLRGAAPRLTERRARDLVESMLAMSFGAEAIGARWSPHEVRSRFVQVLVRDLMRGGAQPAAVRQLLTSGTHPAHGPCSIELASNADSFANGRLSLTRRSDAT